MNGLNCGYLPTVSMCHVVFIFSLGDGYLDSFHFLDIANNVFGNMRKHISPQQTDFIRKKFFTVNFRPIWSLYF